MKSSRRGSRGKKKNIMGVIVFHRLVTQRRLLGATKIGLILLLRIRWNEFSVIWHKRQKYLEYNVQDFYMIPCYIHRYIWLATWWTRLWIWMKKKNFYFIETFFLLLLFCSFLVNKTSNAIWHLGVEWGDKKKKYDNFFFVFNFSLSNTWCNGTH